MSYGITTAQSVANQTQSAIDIKTVAASIYTTYSMYYYRHPFRFLKVMIDEDEDQNIIIKYLSNFSQYLHTLVDEQGDTLLLYACKKGKEALANFLIENKSSPVDKVNQQGYTALIYACQHRMASTVILLLKTGESRPEWVNPQTQEHAYGLANNHGWSEIGRTIKILSRITNELSVAPPPQ
jgi:hypothetical protein